MIKIGTSGFSFPDWVGAVYPSKIKKSDMLSYYGDELGFDTLEVNFTYYALPSETTMESFAKRTSAKFEFVVKGYKGMTHAPFDTRLEQRPAKEDVKKDFVRFMSALEPLQKRDKLGAVLLQFPVFFYPNRENLDYILQAKEWIGQTSTVIEFRNRAWAKRETFDFLKENNLAYCAVDEPRLSRLMPFVNETTSDISYLRFHGRNKNWFNVPTSERYNYLYSDSELKEFIPEIDKMDKSSIKSYIFFNNCHAGSAVRNAQMMKKLLGLPSNSVQGSLF